MTNHDQTVTGARQEGEKMPGDLPPGLKVYLEVTEGPDKGLKLEVTKTITTMGRKDTDLILTDHTISSRHASLEISGDDLLLYDNKSTNGTFVNGEKITTCPLKNLDVIQLGETKVLLSVVHDKYGLYADDFQEIEPDTAPGIVDSTKVGEKGPVPNPKLPDQLQVTLDAVAGPVKGQRFRLSKRSTLIGRRGDIMLDDGQVSTRHAQIEVHSKDKITLKDLASTNGTTVNDKPVSAVKLRHGDTIAIGKTTFVLSVRSG